MEEEKELRMLREVTYWPLIWNLVQEIETKVRDDGIKKDLKKLENFLKKVDSSSIKKEELLATSSGLDSATSEKDLSQHRGFFQTLARVFYRGCRAQLQTQRL